MQHNAGAWPTVPSRLLCVYELYYTHNPLDYVNSEIYGDTVIYVQQKYHIMDHN